MKKLVTALILTAGMSPIGIAAICCAAPYGALQLSVQQTIGGFAVTNNGPSDISDCTIYVNSKFQRSDMTFPVGQRILISGGSLMTNNDVRYDPKVDEFNRAQIICRKPELGDALFK